ncbi:hypothetical protein BGZ99_001611, partial [Dissophora globulifera]
MPKSTPKRLGRRAMRRLRHEHALRVTASSPATPAAPAAVATPAAPIPTTPVPTAPAPPLPAVAPAAAVATDALAAVAPAAALAPVPVATPAAAAASTTFGAGSGVLGLTFGSFQGGDLGALLSGAERLDGQAGNTLGARVCPAASQAD